MAPSNTTLIYGFSILQVTRLIAPVAELQPWAFLACTPQNLFTTDGSDR